MSGSQRKFIQITQDLLHLVYPETCIACERELGPAEKHLCSFCSSELSYTDYHLNTERDTPMDQLFWGRVRIRATYAHLHFSKNSTVQKILFRFKYKNSADIGSYFGKEIGSIIASHSELKDADVLIPVPLHYKKEFLRGYNQSVYLAKGISETSGILLNDRLVYRNTHTLSQTKKNRFERWDNVSSIFRVKDQIKRYKHAIIVDDVITTGSTTEALVLELLQQHPTLQISVVTLAIA